jgi:CMP-N-acetylneuraminic acid synthetase
MKAIIPVKKSSHRVINKNFKPFYNNLSLFDITVDKLIKSGIKTSDIYMSCEDNSMESLAEEWGINFLLRDPKLANNNTPIPDVFRGICDQISGDDDIAWCQVINPLFDDYAECFDIWNNGLKEHDSLVVVHPIRHYFLDSSYNPEGFGFGIWHKKSQLLPFKYQLSFTLSILTRESIKDVGYYVGSKPFWYESTGGVVDIDTEEDFKLAQSIFQFFNSTE